MSNLVDFKYLYRSDKELILALRRKFKLRRDFQYMSSNEENMITCKISRYDLIKIFVYRLRGDIMSDYFILRFLEFNCHIPNKIIFKIIKQKVAGDKYAPLMEYRDTEKIIGEKYNSIIKFTISTNELIRLLTDR